jgi:transcriptional regulator with XRE-family HTH domain
MLQGHSVPAQSQPTETSLEFARKFKEVRERSGLSQAAVAEIVGVGQSTIARIETGEVSPSLNTIHHLLNACHLRLPIIFEPNGDDPLG